MDSLNSGTYSFFLHFVLTPFYVADVVQMFTYFAKRDTHISYIILFQYIITRILMRVYECDLQIEETVDWSAQTGLGWYNESTTIPVSPFHTEDALKSLHAA